MRTMTEQEFIAACNEYGQSWKNAFSVEWSTGGTYGSCWSSELTSASPEEPQELTCLDGFLTEYFPNITFMQYKNITNSVQLRTTSDSDYYGGCTYGVRKTLTYSDLQEKLETMGLLEIITAEEE